MVARARDIHAVKDRKEAALPDLGTTVAHMERVVTLEVALYLGALLIGILLRFLLLDQRPLSVEEGTLAAEAYRISQGRPLEALHRDLLNGYGTALALLLFAGGDGAARVFPAIAGSALVAAPYLLRSTLGRLPALVAAYAMALSPVMLFASREVGGGMAAVALAVLLWAALARGVKELTRGRAYVAAILLAALVASGSEGITLLVTLSMAALLSHPRPLFLLVEGGRFLASALGRWSVALFVASLLILGTNFGSNLSGVQWAAVDGWTGWIRSFSLSVPRGNVLLLLLLYEFPMLVLGLVQLFRTVVRRDRVDSLLSLWTMLLLLLSMVQTGDVTSRVLLPLLPIYLLAARLAGETLWWTKSVGLAWRWLVSALAVAVPIAVAMVMLNRLSTPASDTPAVYLYGEVCLVAVAAITVALLLDGRGKLALAWCVVAVLSAGYLVHGAAFLNYRMETLSREPLVGTQISPSLREAATTEAYIAQYFRTQVTVDPQLRGPLAWYLRSANDVVFSAGSSQGISLSLLRGETASPDPAFDRRPGLYAPSISTRDLTWQEAWRWAMSRDGLVRANQRDIIVRAPAGNW